MLLPQYTRHRRHDAPPHPVKERPSTRSLVYQGGACHIVKYCGMMGGPALEQTRRVFISYSHDSTGHKDRVLQLANKLRADGIDASLDQYIEAPPEGWPKWMQQQLADAAFVLVVCTQPYRAGVEGTKATEKGLGRRWEGTLIYQHIYNAGSLNTRFIPVLMGESGPDTIPLPLQGTTWYCVDDTNGYESLRRRLNGQPPVVVPTIGRSRELASDSGEPAPSQETGLSKPPLRVFLCHSSADKKAVRRLYQQLQQQGVALWLDEENLLAGQNWDQEIRDAISATDVILVCLSRRAITRQGYLSQEINHALTAGHQKPVETLFLIPVRLAKCDVPLGLQKWQWVNLYEANGYGRLVRALRERADEVGAATPRDVLPEVSAGRYVRLILRAAGVATLMILATVAYLKLHKTGDPSSAQDVRSGINPLATASLKAGLTNLPTMARGSGLRAHFINVGQGTSTLIELPRAAFLVDAGTGIERSDDGAAKRHLLDYLRAFFVSRPDLRNKLDSVIISHPHVDHTNALRDVIENHSISRFIDNGGPITGAVGAQITHARSLFSTNGRHYLGINGNMAVDGYTVRLPDAPEATVRLLSGYRDCTNHNNNSIVVYVSVGKSSILLPADASLDDDRCDGLIPYLLSKNLVTHADVLQVPHHGSTSGFDTEFLRRASPRLAVISAGRVDVAPGTLDAFNFGHPRATTVTQLASLVSGQRATKRVFVMDAVKRPSLIEVSKGVYCTCWDGDVVITLDGNGGEPRVTLY